jgi:hypothetical protein
VDTAQEGRDTAQEGTVQEDTAQKGTVQEDTAQAGTVQEDTARAGIALVGIERGTVGTAVAARRPQVVVHHTAKRP